MKMDLKKAREILNDESNCKDDFESESLCQSCAVYDYRDYETCYEIALDAARLIIADLERQLTEEQDRHKEKFKMYADAANDALQQLKQQIESMKCCENCSSYHNNVDCQECDAVNENSTKWKPAE